MELVDNNLHIEVTSRCTLACPACPRTTWKEITKIPMPKQDLNLSDFIQFMDCKGGHNINHFDICGDYGDCIYYPHLFDLIKEFQPKQFKLHTNGSHQPAKFWEQLCEILTSNDEIVFAIDGLEDTNHLYRKNSNWQSIMNAVDIVSQSDVKMSWQTIIFKFNETQLTEIQDLAESKNATWLCKKTHRYQDENLIPTKETNIETHFLYRPEYNKNDAIELEPQCYTEKTVGSDGIFYPCDWIRNPQTLYTSQLWKNKYWLNQLQIKNTNFDSAKEIVKEWHNHVKTCGLNGTAEVLCKMKCRRGIQSHD